MLKEENRRKCYGIHGKEGLGLAAEFIADCRVLFDDGIADNHCAGCY